MHNYDSDLQMFRQATRHPDIKKLRFLRHLAERGDLEHRISGPSSGDFVTTEVAIARPEQPFGDPGRSRMLPVGRNGAPMQFLPTGPAELRRTL